MRKQFLHYDVIVLPIIEWEHRFQRPQHISSAFAADGHRVFYARLTFSGWDAAAKCDAAGPNLWLVSLPGPPDHNRFLQPLGEEAVACCVDALIEMAREQGIQDAILMVQQPFWAKVAQRLRERQGWKIVYDCMDEHDGLTALSADILREEHLLGATADLVVTTSVKLAKKHETTARRHLLLPNAGEFHHFASPGNAPDPLPGVDGPIIGYYGAIMDWFDVEMVHRAATLRPDWTFVLIGAIDIDTGPLQRLENVRFLGEKPYMELPAYLHRFDVAIIPFRIVPIIEATNPVKFYEYLSAGKPVVASPIPELEPFLDLHRMARDGADLVAQAELAMSGDSPEKVRERIEWARGQTWAARYSTLKQSVDSLWGKASIVIVSYQNLGKMRDCVESIDRFTGYPDYEVVVVDNGSDPEVVEFLREFTSTHPRFRLIESEENLGFSSGNNLGMQAVGDDSEYIVLLNNDTVVTKNWLATLVRWLQDPTVGLVGPTTWPNGAANEAAVAVPYKTMEDMHSFSARFVADHRGEAFDIPMLAFYCVAMRREVARAIGPLDEAYGVGMFEDDDYAMRVRDAGLRVVCARDVFIHHVGRSSFGKLEEEVYGRLFRKNKEYYESKWEVAWRPPAARLDLGSPAPMPQAGREAESSGVATVDSATVSLVLVNYNGIEHLGPCLESIAQLDFDKDRLEVVVVDNASTDGSVDMLRGQWPGIKVICNSHNVGFSRACNQAAQEASGQYLAFLNNDMRVHPDWLDGLLEPISRDPRLACVGSMVMNWEGTAVEFSGRHEDPFSLAYEPLPQAYNAGQAADSYALFVSGGSMLLRRAEFLGAGGFDPRYFMYHEDVDLCWRLWVGGKRCSVAPRSIVYHRGGASSRKLQSTAVLGWSQKHLLWTVLKNFDDDSLREALPLLIYFLVERGRWSEDCQRSLHQVFEETQAALGSILHDRSRIQRERKVSDPDIFYRVGHPLAFVMRSPLFVETALELTRRYPLDVVAFDDPGQVAAALAGLFRESQRLRSENATAWQEDANRKFRRHQLFSALREGRPAFPAGTSATVAISSWGPQEAVEGQPLNQLPTGSSSLWARGGGDLENVVSFIVAGTEHPCTREGGTLTCELSAEASALLKQAGRHAVALRMNDGSTYRLGDVIVRVSEGRGAARLASRIRHRIRRMWR